MQSIFVSALLLLPGQTTSLQIQPAAVTLTGPQATQRLSILRIDESGFTEDVTGRAEYTSFNPKIVTVDENGLLQAVGDGETIVMATFGDKKATTKVKVQKT